MTAAVCPTCGQRYEHAGYCPTDGQPLVVTDDAMLGTEVGRYRVTRLLGEGGMGRVYLAVQPTIGSRVAIKILAESCARDPDLLDRFFAEARAVNLIRHESIVSVLDMAQLDDGRPYIVMEYIEGRTLAAVVRAGPVALGGLVQVMSEVLSALTAAHALGIIHRDLKPDNILVTAEGHAKVLDFGIAKLAPELQASRSPRTRTGALLGTPQYMAPEQISGAGGVDPRTDVYAAGVVVYELATGKLPFVGETLFDLMRGHMELPPPPRGLRREIPPAFEQVILTALAKKPDARFASAAAMAQALQQAAASLPADQWRSLSGRGAAAGSGPITDGELPLAFRTTKPVGAAPTVRGGGRVWLAIGAVVIAAIAVAVTLFFVAPGQAPTRDVAVVVIDAAVAGSNVVAADAAVAVSSTPSAPVPIRAKPPSAPTPARTHAPAGGPTIVGGGSAADHGVHIGPGVTLNPGVIIGGDSPAPPVPGAPPEQLSHPADYDPRRFDPIAFLPKAEQLARTLLPDARLTSFEFDPVFPDGHADLTLDSRDHGYEFRSPSRSAFPAGRPRNMPIERKCRVTVEVEPRSVTARVVSSDACDDRFIRAPRCSFAAVWKRALAQGVASDMVARIGWLSDQKWFFDTDLAGKGGGVSSFADDCP